VGSQLSIFQRQLLLCCQSLKSISIPASVEAMAMNASPRVSHFRHWRLTRDRSWVGLNSGRFSIAHR
jgi:hypothetical protein